MYIEAQISTLPSYFPIPVEYSICILNNISNAELYSEVEAKKLMKELTTMLSFDHPNVLSLIGMCLDRKAPLIIMPFMSNGSVLDYVRQHKQELFLCTENSDTEVILHITYELR